MSATNDKPASGTDDEFDREAVRCVIEIGEFLERSFKILEVSRMSVDKLVVSRKVSERNLEVTCREKPCRDREPKSNDVGGELDGEPGEAAPRFGAWPVDVVIGGRRLRFR